MYGDAMLICRETMAGLYTPRPVMTVDRWCDEHRVLPSEGASAESSGGWDSSRTPYLIGIMRAYTDPEPREIALLKSTQLGATELIFNCTLYDADRGIPQLIVYPTATKGQDTNRRRLVPSIRCCEPVRTKLRGIRPLTATELRLADGTLIWFGYTGSSDSLRGDPCGSIKCDEIDAYDCSREDALENCRSRARNFAHAKILKVSTPMGDETGITREYTTADVRHQYHTPCPSCGGFFELWDFSLLGWRGGVNVDPAEAARNCWVTCPHCSDRIREENKEWMVQHGLWITQDEHIDSDGSITMTLDGLTRRRLADQPMVCRLTADFFRGPDAQPDASIRDQGMDPVDAHALRDRLGIRIKGTRNHGPSWGFRNNTMQSLLAKRGWSGLVYDFVKYKGRPEPTWWRDNLGQSPTRTAKTIEAANLITLCKGRLNGGHEHGQCPSWTIAAFGGVDVQKDCIKIMVKAYGPMMRRQAIVATRILPRDEHLKLTEPAIESALYDLMLGAGMPIQTDSIRGGTDDGFQHRRARPVLFIDSGYWTDDVYALVYRLTRRGCRVFACKGIENRFDDPRPFRVNDVRYNKLNSGERISDHTPNNLVLVNGHYFKSAIASRLHPIDTGDDEPLVMPTDLPSYEGWTDLDTPENEPRRNIAAQVIRELTAEQLIIIGAGSGRSGPDGRGPRKEVWRKINEDRTNDFLDAAVYCDANAMYHGVHEMTGVEIPSPPVMSVSQTESTPSPLIQTPSAPSASSTSSTSPAQSRIQSGFRGGRGPR